MASLLSSSSTSSALTVVVPPTIHCGGGFVEGEVLLLNFRQLQEENFDEVCVELSGDIQTRVRRNKHLYEEKHRILSTQFYVWTRGAAYPQPDTDVLHLPFRFPLPDGLPPSFHFRIWEINTSILYAIDTTGVRRGKFKVNKKVHTPIMVLPKDEAGVGNVWAEKIRKGIWGEHATARVMVSIPDVPVLPLFTPLPFLITITTMTPPMTRAKALSHTPNKPIFPAPPQSHTDIHFRLRRNLSLNLRPCAVREETTLKWLNAYNGTTDTPQTYGYVLGNPLIAQTMLRHDLTIAMHVPPKIVIVEKADGSGTRVTYDNPASVIVVPTSSGERVNPELAEVVVVLSGKFEALIQRITKAD